LENAKDTVKFRFGCESRTMFWFRIKNKKMEGSGRYWVFEMLVQMTRMLGQPEEHWSKRHADDTSGRR
jgi:hypothetical protein